LARPPARASPARRGFLAELFFDELAMDAIAQTGEVEAHRFDDPVGIALLQEFHDLPVGVDDVR
jgi:hypothetical protein